MNLKPFDLEKALAGEPVVTRNGLKVIEINCFQQKTDYPVRALFESGSTNAYTKNGKVYLEGDDNNYDLFMAPKTKTMWYCVFKDRSGVINTSSLYESEEVMVDIICITHNCTILATHSIEIEQ